MNYRRIIPCLDIKDGRTVKGVNFVDIKDAGDPVELATLYCQQGADELVFLDIAATVEGRKTFVDLVQRLAQHVTVPFTVGGGISELADVDQLIKAGASKVSVNSAALKRPELINEIAQKYGSERCVCAIDAKEIDGEWMCFVNGGNTPTDKTLLDWALEAQERGAGEILFTSMDHDGVQKGFANDALAVLADHLDIPVIASGGAGCMKDFAAAILHGEADAVLAAGVFHFGQVEIPALKVFLRSKGIRVRI